MKFLVIKDKKISFWGIIKFIVDGDGLLPHAQQLKNFHYHPSVKNVIFSKKLYRKNNVFL
jgi:hypothetical protein